MYYVLFHYKKKRGKAWIPCSIEAKVIEFLHESYEDIEVERIIEVKAEHRLGLVVTKDYVKSALEPEEETESLVPIEVVDNAKAILKEKKEKLKELETEEPSAIEDTDEGLTDDQKVEKQIDEADALIEREKEREKQRKKGWKLCTVCNSNRVAPWNKKKICSECQNKKKTDRPHAKHKEFKAL